MDSSDYRANVGRCPGVEVDELCGMPPGFEAGASRQSNGFARTVVDRRGRQSMVLTDEGDTSQELVAAVSGCRHTPQVEAVRPAGGDGGDDFGGGISSCLTNLGDYQFGALVDVEGDQLRSWCGHDRPDCCGGTETGAAHELAGIAATDLDRVVVSLGRSESPGADGLVRKELGKVRQRIGVGGLGGRVRLS